MPAKASKIQSDNFEAALVTLDEIVQKLERGDIPLEEALKQFEAGINLVRTCQEVLKNAEQRVEVLLQKDASE